MSSCPTSSGDCNAGVPRADHREEPGLDLGTLELLDVLTNSHLVNFEFYGLARLRTGISRVTIHAATLHAALLVLDRLYPNLHALKDSQLAQEYLLSVGAQQFTADLATPLQTGDLVLIFGADAGG